MSNKTFRRENMDNLCTEEYITEADAIHNIELREKIVTFLICAYSGSLIVTFLIIILQGFKLFGFNIPENILTKLVYALYGELAGLFGMVIGNLFKKK